MKRVTVSLLALMLVGPLLLAGCSYHIGDYALMSVSEHNMKLEYRKVGRMSGSDNAFLLFSWLPLGSASIGQATQEAIQAGGGVYLANATVSWDYWTVFIISSSGYTVEGDVFAPVSRGDLLEEGTETYRLIETESGLAMESTSTGDQVVVQDITEMVQN